jgi:hypothetical protein
MVGHGVLASGSSKDVMEPCVIAKCHDPCVCDGQGQEISRPVCFSPCTLLSVVVERVQPPEFCGGARSVFNVAVFGGMGVGVIPFVGKCSFRMAVEAMDEDYAGSCAKSVLFREQDPKAVCNSEYRALTRIWRAPACKAPSIPWIRRWRAQSFARA